MDIGKAFSYVFEDESWVSKVLIGGLLFFIPVIGQLAVLGYSYKVAQNVARGVERPLPEWGEFGDMLMRGFMGWVISLVYALPAVVLGLLIGGIAIVSASRNSDRGSAMAGLTGLCLFPLIAIIAIVCMIAAQSAVARYLATDQVGEAFKFGEVLASLRANIGAWVMLILVSILASFVASLGFIACGVGILFTSFYAQLVVGHALGQTIRQLGLGRYAAPAPVNYGPPPSYS